MKQKTKAALIFIGIAIASYAITFLLILADFITNFSWGAGVQTLQGKLSELAIGTILFPISFFGGYFHYDDREVSWLVFVMPMLYSLIIFSFLSRERKKLQVVTVGIVAILLATLGVAGYQYQKNYKWIPPETTQFNQCARTNNLTACKDIIKLFGSDEGCTYWFNEDDQITECKKIYYEAWHS